MPVQSEFELALEALKASGFQLDQNWKRAHAIAQAHEGEQMYDAVHAFCHRIEGDLGNAAYWDRRAGTDFGGSGHEAELEALRAFIDA